MLHHSSLEKKKKIKRASTMNLPTRNSFVPSKTYLYAYITTIIRLLNNILI